MTVYSVGFNATTKKVPSALDVTVRDSPVLSFATVTVAPGITAPFASATVPVIRPFSAWPNENVTNVNTMMRMAGSDRADIVGFIVTPVI